VKTNAAKIAESGANRYELDLSEQLVVWASRHYLWSALRGTPAPDFIFEAFERAGIDFLYYALDRVLLCLLAAPTSLVTVHDLRCPCVALHEQALLMALRRLQRNDDAGFCMAMSAVMLPSAVKVSEPAMKLLAAGMTNVDRDRLSWLRSISEIADETAAEHERTPNARTIN
jgi:hypothetical protein